MKFIGFSLFCAISTLHCLAEEPSEPKTPPKLSSRLVSEIRSFLPKYESPPAIAPSQQPQGSLDADVLVLPKVVVRESAPPRIDSNDLLTSKALDKKLAREFKNSLEGLDGVLNGFSIPLISPSMAARGRAAYKARQRQGLNDFIESTKAADSKSSAEMKKAVTEMNSTEVWQQSAGR